MLIPLPVLLLWGATQDCLVFLESALGSDVAVRLSCDGLDRVHVVLYIVRVLLQEVVRGLSLCNILGAYELFLVEARLVLNHEINIFQQISRIECKLRLVNNLYRIHSISIHITTL